MSILVFHILVLLTKDRGIYFDGYSVACLWKEVVAKVVKILHWHMIISLQGGLEGGLCTNINKQFNLINSNILEVAPDLTGSL